MSSSRRSFLKFAALLSGSAGVAGFVPESVQRAFAIEPKVGSTFLDAEHIVILMQENRSFDHALGSLQGVRGFNDPRAIRQANGNSVFLQTSATTGETYGPWRLDLLDTRITWMGSVPHSRNSQVDAWNEGLCDRWLDAKTSSNAAYRHIPITMGHYTRRDLPFYYALADAFTVCDQSYSSVMSSTSPNRSMFWTGTIRDVQTPESRVYMRNDQLFRDRLGWTTFPERLSQAGISWRFYQNELSMSSGLTAEENSWLSNFGCNILECFASYRVETAPTASPLLEKQLAAAQIQASRLEEQLSEPSGPGDADDLRTRLDLARTHVAMLKALLATSGAAGYRQLNANGRALHDAAFVTNRNDPHFRSLQPLRISTDGALTINVPRGDVLHQFREDVEAGTLPVVSWLTAPEHFSDHPDSPWYGAWWVSEILDILTKNPDVWKKTIFILTYDENDGYFDHAPSFVAPDPRRPETGATSPGLDAALEYTYAADERAQGVPEDQARSGPVGMGFRVPTIIVSPWTRGGWVNSQLFDHTSTLQFLEHFLEAKFNRTVREENISAWRRTVAGDLTSCFRTDKATGPALTYLNRDPFIERIVAARSKDLPTGYMALTAAEIHATNQFSRTAGVISQQEPGTRPACALPYELYAHGATSPDGKAFQLELRAGDEVFGRRAAGAPFNVYLCNLKAKPGMRVATYTVRAGDTLAPAFALQEWEGGSFECEVVAPNGFFRRFKGSAHQPPPQVRMTMAEHEGRALNTVELQLHNPAATAQTFTITDNSYGAAPVTKTLAPGAMWTVDVSLERSHNWYDLSIQAEGSEATVQLAGRVEAGTPTRTDPLMGRVSPQSA